MFVIRSTPVLSVVILSATLLLMFASGQAERKGHSPAPHTYPQTREHLGTDPIQLHVTVTGKDDVFVNGLQQNDFQVLIEKAPARIVSFDNQDAPSSIGIVFDSSGSVRSGSKDKTRRDFAMLREALSGFLSQSNPSNEYFLLGFNAKPQLLVDWTSDHTRLINGFNDLIIFGYTAFYDSCYVAIDKLTFGSYTKRVLLVISDGQDNLSSYTFKELRDLIRSTGVLVYCIYFSDRPDGWSTLGQEGQSILRDLSVPSGGRVYIKTGYPIKPREMPSVLETIADELRHQYSMSVVPTEPSTVRQWRKIKTLIKPSISDGKIRTRTREGFYSVKPKGD